MENWSENTKLMDGLDLKTTITNNIMNLVEKDEPEIIITRSVYTVPVDFVLEIVRKWDESNVVFDATDVLECNIYTRTAEDAVVAMNFFLEKSFL